MNSMSIYNMEYSNVTVAQVLMKSAKHVSAALPIHSCNAHNTDNTDHVNKH
jgi:hypothetical protein